MCGARNRHRLSGGRLRLWEVAQRPPGSPPSSEVLQQLLSLNLLQVGVDVVAAQRRSMLQHQAQHQTNFQRAPMAAVQQAHATWTHASIRSCPSSSVIGVLHVHEGSCCELVNHQVTA